MDTKPSSTSFLTIVIFTASFLVTAGSALFQYMTGPSYPVKGNAVLVGKSISYKLQRSHGGESDCPITISTNDGTISGVLEWKRFKSDDRWTDVPLRLEGGTLSANLPHQPPAGKLEYRIILTKGSESAIIPGTENIVIRFRGDVPWYILIPHILAMFGGMFLSTWTGISAFRKRADLHSPVLWTIATLVAGGFILGPLVQWYAFGAFWTGWPVGSDLTDNKTAIALLSWVVAYAMIKRSQHPGRWAIGASVITLVVYLIPHSLFGSELDYRKLDRKELSYKIPADRRNNALYESR